MAEGGGAYVVVELDVGVFDEGEEVGELRVCLLAFFSCLLVCGVWEEGDTYTLVVCPATVGFGGFGTGHGGAGLLFVDVFLGASECCAWGCVDESLEDEVSKAIGDGGKSWKVGAGSEVYISMVA